MPILQTHAYTHARASTSLHTRWTSKQAKRTRSRRRTRKKSNIQTPTSRTTRLTCRNQDAWCECGKYKAQQTQFLSHRSLKKQLKTPNRTEQLEEITKKMRRRNLWLQKTLNSLGEEAKGCWDPPKNIQMASKLVSRHPRKAKLPSDTLRVAKKTTFFCPAPPWRRPQTPQNGPEELPEQPKNQYSMA